MYHILSYTISHTLQIWCSLNNQFITSGDPIYRLTEWFHAGHAAIYTL